MKEKWKNLLLAIILSSLLVGVIEYGVFLPGLNNLIYLNQIVSETGNPLEGVDGLGDDLLLVSSHNPYDDPEIQQYLLFMIAFAIVGIIILTAVFYVIISHLRKTKK